MKVKCWECGEEIEYNLKSEILGYELKRIYTSSKKVRSPKTVWKRIFCEKCSEKVKNRMANEKSEYIRLKSKMMFERAVENLEKQLIDFVEYEEAIKTVQSFAEEHTEKFESSSEMIAAIMLVNKRITSKMQYKIGNYRVDILLPDLNVALEIDGERHNENKVVIKDSRRDVKIRELLGGDWEVVRIPSNYIDTDAEKMVDAIIAIRDEKKRMREENCGIIPSYFSKRNEGYAYMSESSLKKYNNLK